MAVIALPATDAIASMLENLLGREVYVGTGAVGDPAYIGRYITRDDHLVAVGAADMRLLAFAGSALSMVPPGTAQDVAANGDPTSAMIENLHEVLNVAASLMIDAGSDHVRLDGMVAAGDVAPDTAALLASGARSDFVVDVDGYGKGGLSLIARA